MKLLAYLKLAVKAIIKELPVFLLSFALFPLLLSYTMGLVQKDMFVPTINEPLFTLYVEDEDDSPSSRGLMLFLESEEVSQVLTIVAEKEQGEYFLKIPAGYEKSLVGEGEAVVAVEMERDSSLSLAEVITNLADSYNLEVSEGLVLQNRLEGLDLPAAERVKLADEIGAILSTAYSANTVQNRNHQIKRELDSHEYYSISFVSFLLVMFLLGVIGASHVEKEIGLQDRVLTTPTSRIQLFNFSFASGCINVLVASSVYVFAYRWSGLSFQGSLPLLLLIIVVQSVLISALGMFLCTLLKRKYAMVLVQISLQYQVIFGGMIGPLHKWTDKPIFKTLSRFKPDALITGSYRNFVLYNNLAAISTSLLQMTGVFLVLYAANIVLVKMKWGENR